MSVSSNKQIVTDGLVFYTDPANELSYIGTGTDLKDIVGGYDGALVNTPTYSTDNGGIFDFNGTNEHVDCTSFVIPAEITVSAWINPDQLSSARMINASDNSNTGKRNWQLRTNTDGAVTAIAFHASGNIQLTTTESLSVGAWRMVSFTTDNTNLKVYFDGVEKATVAFPHDMKGNGVTGDLLLGARRSTNIADRFNGKQGPTMVYDRGLSAAELLSNYNSQKDRFI